MRHNRSSGNAGEDTTTIQRIPSLSQQRYYQEKFEEACDNLPPSGGGGFHQAQLGAANYGVMAGLSDEAIFTAIRESVHGTRRVPNREIWDAIEKARSDHEDPDYRVPVRRRFQKVELAVFQERGREELKRLLAEGKGATEGDFRQSSPIRLEDPGPRQTRQVMGTLWSPGDLLFSGGFKDAGDAGGSIRPRDGWLTAIHKMGNFIIPNPVNGLPMPKKSGDGLTMRGDANVTRFLYAVVEFDNLSRDEQLAFWMATNLPVVALIDSGGKSIHGWVRINGVETLDQWELKVRQGLFERYLIPMGVDGACKNAGRLSRTPGVFRQDTKRLQRCLYLAREGSNNR